MDLVGLHVGIKKMAWMELGTTGEVITHTYTHNHITELFTFYLNTQAYK